ncbi:CRISPR-associated protein Cas4 [Actinokineospora guangxiensis]|uniref:CRISPR-associated exonuclease Cas4 n=1 Tax=Actinokineospora guangxiensis TaxID=1490288 RepID=A0ABW0ER63_9PSEU
MTAPDEHDLPHQGDSIPISAIEHHAYCPRQAVLIHREGYFDANTDTVRGDLAHQAVDRRATTTIRGNTVWTSLPVWSNSLGVHGVCDTVHLRDGRPIPVEHKSGGYRPGSAADLQVAAQVVCLREMFATDISYGEVFAGRTRRRYTVTVDDTLLQRLTDTVTALRAALAAIRAPTPVNDRRCTRCSLKPGCLPDIPTTPTNLFTPQPPADWTD